MAGGVGQGDQTDDSLEIVEDLLNSGSRNRLFSSW
jgi:hypothetical protein